MKRIVFSVVLLMGLLQAKPINCESVLVSDKLKDNVGSEKMSEILSIKNVKSENFKSECSIEYVDNRSNRNFIIEQNTNGYEINFIY
ncbi:MAG: hypothetical protein Q8J85_07255 [Sulfuricurvum sp.]|nr:hypothetical protein [Sulfuricurvum sp.]MDP3022976.1 hypothetical protein [Sulfuricurvum sp.]